MSTLPRPKLTARLGFGSLGLLVVATWLVVGVRAEATSLYDTPVEITYELTYQTTPDPTAPLTEATGRWTLRSLSDWDFEFIGGPDDGTVYRLRPDGTMSATDGRTTVDPNPARFPAGTEMVPLPDMAFDRLAALALGDGDLPGVSAVVRSGAGVEEALKEVVARTGLAIDQLRAVVVTRPANNDVYRWDPQRADWVGIEGDVTETVVVDDLSGGVLLRQVEFDGALVRRIAVVEIRPLP